MSGGGATQECSEGAQRGMRACPASAARGAKNNHILQTSVTALHRRHTGLRTMPTTLTASVRTVALYLILPGERKSTLPPWPTPFTVLVVHRQTSQQRERANWTFSWEHRPDPEAPSYFASTPMSRTARGAASGPLSSPDKPSRAQIHPLKGERGRSADAAS